MNDTRPDNNERMMIRAELESWWSTCQRLKVGAVISDYYGNVLASGYNGAPRKLEHCNRKPVLDGRCTYCVHAERNAINSAAKTGTSLHGGIIYTTHRPCIACVNDIIQVGLLVIYYMYDYDSDQSKPYVQKILAESGVKLQQITPMLAARIMPIDRIN